MIFLRPLRACGISQPLCLCAAIPTRTLIIIVILDVLSRLMTAKFIKSKL